MDKQIIQLIFLLLFFSACNIKTDRHDKKNSTNDSIINDNKFSASKDSIDYFKRANEFITKILGDKIRKHEFKKIQEGPRHLEIFSADGLIRIIAYSNRDYPKRIEPNDYEHFVLFCLEYNSKLNAEHSFEELRRLTKIDWNKIDSLDSLTSEKVDFLFGQSKPGGLIFQNENLIFSLVETCRETPIGGTWSDYENQFISNILKNSVDSLTVLNADCGEMKYIETQLKPVHKIE